MKTNEQPSVKKQAQKDYSITKIQGEFVIDRNEKSSFGHYTGVSIPVAVSGNKKEAELLIAKANMQDELIEALQTILTFTDPKQVGYKKAKALLKQAEGK